MRPSSIIADEIKERVKMPELVERYGFEIQRGNRIPCPFHGGKNANLGLKDDYCHCFKCGYSADVIKFVQDFFSVGFSDAVSKINEDFALGLSFDSGRGKRQQMEDARQAFLRKQEQKKKEERHEQLFNAWLDAQSELMRLLRQKKQYKPSSPAEGLHPKFAEALNGIEQAKRAMEEAEERLFEYERAEN